MNVSTDCIQSLTLYDVDHNEIGSAEMIDKTDWTCQVVFAGQVYSKRAESFEAAFEYLAMKSDQLSPGGMITALAEFAIVLEKKTETKIYTARIE